MNQDIQQILVEVRALHRRMDTLNTRLFGNPEGDAGDEGRLVVLERALALWQAADGAWPLPPFARLWPSWSFLLEIT